MKTGSTTWLVLIDQRLYIDLVNHLTNNANGVIGRDEFIQVGRKQHRLLLVVGLEKNAAVIALFHTVKTTPTVQTILII